MCNHYWKIEGQVGRSSIGVCIYCGKTNKFLNSFPDTYETNMGFYQSMGMGKKTFMPENNVDELLIDTKSGIKTQKMIIDSAIKMW